MKISEQSNVTVKESLVARLKPTFRNTLYLKAARSSKLF